MTRYRFREFIVLAVAGRIIWTFAYVGLGYIVGTDFEAASTFLMNLSGLLVSSTLVIAVATVLFWGHPPPASD
jgi:membrane protein DedA with SNARE-associated domain